MSTQYIPTLSYNRIRIVLAWIAIISTLFQTIMLTVDGTMGHYPLAAIVVGYVLLTIVTAIVITVQAAILYVVINGLGAVLNTIIMVVVFVAYPFYMVYRAIAAISRKFS